MVHGNGLYSIVMIDCYAISSEQLINNNNHDVIDSPVPSLCQLGYDIR